MKGRAYHAFGQGGALLQFFAAFYTGTSLLTVLVQAIGSRIVLEKLGPARTAALLPASTAVVATGAIVVPGLSSAVIARGLESVVSNSLYRGGYEVLFTPVPAREKRSLKAVADVGASRMGDFLAAAIGQAVVFVSMPHTGIILSAIAAVCSLIGAWVAFQLHAGYSQSLARGYPNDPMETTMRSADSGANHRSNGQGWPRTLGVPVQVINGLATLNLPVTVQG